MTFCHSVSVVIVTGVAESQKEVGFVSMVSPEHNLSSVQIRSHNINNHGVGVTRSLAKVNEESKVKWQNWGWVIWQ